MSPLYRPNPTKNTPSYLNIAGHSYLNTALGVPDTAYRIDNILQGMLNISKYSQTNRALSGSTILADGMGNASYVTILQQVKRAPIGAPYIGRGGCYVNCWGVNDIGRMIPSSDFPAKTIYAQVRTAFKHALRTVISRQRAATVFECGGTDAETNWAFGAGMSVGTVNTFNSGTGYRFCTSTTNANATFTIPADFPGGTITIGCVGSAGAFGGTATVGGTFSGTGGASIVTSNMMPTGSNHGHYCRRFTNLPASDAGKTIILTVTSLDASGNFVLDYAQIEAGINIPLVVVCNIARLVNAAAYASYSSPASYWSNGSNAGASGDTDVADFNAAIAEVVAEFDQYVQISDIDTALAKTAANFGADGIHPNPVGSQFAAKAIYNTIVNAPVGTNNLVPDWRTAEGLRQPRNSQYWYTPYMTQMTTSTLAMVTGQAYAFPVIVSEGTERWDGISFEVTAAATGTGGTVRTGIYDDEDWLGYPQCIVADWGTTAITSTGVKTVAAVNNWFDPGLYWLVLNMEAQGGTIAGTLRAFTGMVPLIPQSTSGAAPTIGTWVGNTCYRVTGVAAAGLPGQFPLAATVLATAAPVLCFRKA